METEAPSIEDTPFNGMMKSTIPWLQLWIIVEIIFFT
jgi:hypothetical protein